MIRCPMPWTGILVDPDGSIKNCAMSQHSLGNIQKHPIDQILENSINQDIRQTLRNGQWPSNCQNCRDREEIDPEFSNRAYQNQVHAHLGDSIYGATHNLRQLDLRWSNTCNFACIYCGPHYSSLWAKELGRNINVTADYRHSLTEYALSNAEQLLEIYLAGGEPLMIKENIDFLDKIHQLNPNVKIRITTNLSRLDTGVYDQLRKFSQVHWEISLDALDEEFAYIRYPGDWAVVQDNLKRLLDEWPQDTVRVTMNYFLLNSLSIVDTGRHLINLGIDPNLISVHYLTFPKYLDARNISEKNIPKIQDYLNSYTNMESTFGTSLKNCSEFLLRPFDKQPDIVVKSLQNLDIRRNLNFTAVFPHILGYLT